MTMAVVSVPEAASAAALPRVVGATRGGFGEVIVAVDAMADSLGLKGKI